MDAVYTVPEPVNEPVVDYAPGTPQRASLQRRLAELAAERVDLTMTIDGRQRMASGDRIDVVQPHRHRHVLGVTAEATPDDVAAAVAAAKESGGQINYVTDEQILHAYRLMASAEGIFAEPASAASLAGVIKLREEGLFKPGDRVVCVLTGHGLKDPNIAIKTVAAEPVVVPGASERT